MRNSDPAKLSDTLHQRLNAYALAASAVSAGLFSLGQAAQAEIVYKHANKQITPNHAIPLDLNGDHKTDFHIKDSFTCTSFCEYIEGAITVIPGQTRNETVGFMERGYQYASALAAGVRIGKKSPFLTGNAIMVTGGYDAGTTSVGWCDGPWVNATKRYVGLKFKISGKTHYGWARFNTSCAKNGENTGVLTGYAYETIPGKSIIAGKTKGKGVVEVAEPASLGRLAQGTAGEH